MDPNQPIDPVINSPAPSTVTQSDEPATDVAQEPTPVVPSETFAPQPITRPPDPFAKPKKDRKRLFIILAIIAVLIVIGIIVLMLSTQPAKTAVKRSPVTTQKVVATPADVQDATSSITDGAQNEASITNTDDSSEAADASTSAGNVGDSINENSF